MLAADVVAARFRPTMFRPGYDQGQVDDFLDRVQAVLAEHERGRRSAALTPEDVVATTFSPTRFRQGYDQDDVDDFLDQIVIALRQLSMR